MPPTTSKIPKKPTLGRGVNNSFEGRTGFGILRDFQEFFGIFWDIYPSVLKLNNIYISQTWTQWSDITFG